MAFATILQTVFERDAEILKLKEIAEAYSRVAPNWYETKIKARDQEKLLRITTRMIQHAIATLDNDLYATRVRNAREYLEDALVDLDEYKMEGDPEAQADIPILKPVTTEIARLSPETLAEFGLDEDGCDLNKKLVASVQMTCKHPDRIMHNSGSTADTNESYRCYNCESCGKSWTVYE